MQLQKRGRTQQHLTFNILFQRVSLRHIKYICFSSRSHPRIDNAPYITRKSTGESKSMTKRFTALEMSDKAQSLEKVSSIKQRKKSHFCFLLIHSETWDRISLKSKLIHHFFFHHRVIRVRCCCCARNIQLALFVPTR